MFCKITPFRKYLWWLIVSLNICAHRGVAADSENSLLFRSALVSGTISQDQPSGATISHTIGGLNLGLGLLLPLKDKLSYEFQFNVLLDVINRRTIRQGGSINFNYSLMGGVYRQLRKSEALTWISENNNELSLLVQGSFHRYSASSDNQKNRLEGTVFDMRLGIAYRRGAWITDLVTALLTLPASSDNLDARYVELGVSYLIF